MSREEISIRDNCVCGALFQANGDAIFSRHQHKDWLKHHEVCLEIFRTPTQANSKSHSYGPKPTKKPLMDGDNDGK